MSYVMDFQTRFSGGSDLDKIGAIIAEIGKRTVATDGQLKSLESQLQADTRAGKSLSASLLEVVSSNASMEKGVRTSILAVLGLGTATDGTTRAQQRAASEIQRYGRIQAQAEAEDRKRTAAIEAQRVALDKATVAAEKAAIAEELRGRRRIDSGVRGALGFAQASGVAPGGTSQAVSGIGNLFGGISGAAIGVVGVTIATKEMLSLTIEAAASARELKNVATQFGLTIDQAQRLSIMAKLTGESINSLAGASRTLSVALDDPTGAGKKQVEQLNRLGITTLQSSGAQKEFGQILQEVLERLSQIPNVAERVHESQLLLGRGSRVLQPLIEDLPRLRQSADDLASSLHRGVNQELAGADRTIQELNASWDIFKQNLASKVAPIVISFVQQGTETIQGRHVFPNEGNIQGTPDSGSVFSEADKFGQALRAAPGGLRPGPTGDAAIKASQQALLRSIAAGDAVGKEIQAAYDKTRDGLERRIALEKKAADTAREEAVQTGATLAFKIDKQKDMNQHLERETALRAQLKALDAKPSRLGTEVEDLLESLRAKEGGPGSAVLERAEKFIRDKGLGGQQANQITAAASAAAIREQLAAGPAYQPFRLTARDLRITGKQEQPGTSQLSALSSITGIGNPDGLDEESSKDLEAGLRKATELAKKRQADQIGLSRKLLDDNLGVQRESITRQFSKAETMNELQLGGGSKSDGVERTYERRLQLATQLYSLTVDRAAKELDLTKRAELEDKARAELTKQRQDAELEREIKIAEARKQQQERFVSGVQGGFSALLHGGPAGLGQFAKSQVEGLATTVVGNAARLVYPQVEGKFQLPGTGTADHPTVLGQLFSGSLLGPQVTGKDAGAKLLLESQFQLRDSNLGLKSSIDYLSSALTGGQQVPGSSAPAAPSLSSSGNLPGILGGSSSSSLGPLASAIGIGGTAGFAAGPIASIIRDSARLSTSIGNGGSSLPFGADPGSGEGGGAESVLKSFSKSGIKSNALNVLFGNHADAGSGEGGSSVGQQVGAVASLATAGYAAFRGISEIAKGGSKNVLGGIATTAAAIAPFTGPAAPFIEAGALAAGLVSSLLPDQRKQRQDAINSELQAGIYQSPVSQSRQQDILGNFVDSDKYGRVRTSDLSAVPITTAPYTTKRNGVWYDIPGSTLSPFSQNGGGQISSAPPMQVTVNMNSMDAKSGIDYFRNNPGVAHAAIHAGLTQATGPAQKAVRSVVGLQ